MGSIPYFTIHRIVGEGLPVIAVEQIVNMVYVAVVGVVAGSLVIEAVKYRTSRDKRFLL